MVVLEVTENIYKENLQNRPPGLWIDQEDQTAKMLWKTFTSDVSNFQFDNRKDNRKLYNYIMIYMQYIVMVLFSFKPWKPFSSQISLEKVAFTFNT